MGNAPKDQIGAEDTERDSDQDSVSVVGPVCAASADTPPTEAKCGTAEKKCRWTQDPLMAGLTAAGLLALIVYTGYTRQLVIDGEMFSAEQGKLTRAALVAANRAWIAPQTLEVEGDAKGTGDLALKVHYANIGKSPALNLRQGFNGDSIPNINATKPLFAGDYNACDRVAVDKQAVVVYPDSRDHWQNATFPRKQIPDTIKNDLIALTIHGCFAYETMNEPHSTWFCLIVYRDGKTASIGATTFCGDGQGAD